MKSPEPIATDFISNDDRERLAALLEQCHISWDDYHGLVRGLIFAAPRQRVIYRDDEGIPLPSISIRRNFGEFAVMVEDRGSQYTVWILRTNPAQVTISNVFCESFLWPEDRPRGSLRNSHGAPE